MPSYRTSLVQGSIQIEHYQSVHISILNEDKRVLTRSENLQMYDRLAVIRGLVKTLDLPTLKVALGDFEHAIAQKEKEALEVKRNRFDDTRSVGLTESQLDRIFAIIDEH